MENTIPLSENKKQLPTVYVPLKSLKLAKFQIHALLKILIPYSRFPIDVFFKILIPYSGFQTNVGGIARIVRHASFPTFSKTHVSKIVGFPT